MKTYSVKIQRENLDFSEDREVEGFSLVLKLITQPDVISYTVNEGDRILPYTEILSHWRHPSLIKYYPNPPLPCYPFS